MSNSCTRLSVKEHYLIKSKYVIINIDYFVFCSHSLIYLIILEMMDGQHVVFIYFYSLVIDLLLLDDWTI